MLFVAMEKYKRRRRKSNSVVIIVCILRRPLLVVTATSRREAICGTTLVAAVVTNRLFVQLLEIAGAYLWSIVLDDALCCRPRRYRSTERKNKD
jgi:hypothetical protein